MFNIKSLDQSYIMFKCVWEMPNVCVLPCCAVAAVTRDSEPTPGPSAAAD